MEELSRSRAVFVQPHLDDVGLSCGGSVARAADAGDHPVVLGVFAGAAMSERRFGEDERACALLGATPVWLAFQDAPYRGYDSVEALFGELSDDDPLIRQIAGELVATWRRTPRATLYLPLGVGGHIDHALCHATGGLLEAEGVPVRYYEDYPYAAVPGMVGARLARLGAFIAELVDITAWIDHRVRAAEAYASQTAVLAAITGRRAPLGQAMRRYAAVVAGELPGHVAHDARLAERFYRRAGASAGANHVDGPR